MPQSWREFIFSFGMMLFGVFLLFAFSLGFNLKSSNSAKSSFPMAGLRLRGGDVSFENYAIHHPTVPLKQNNQEYNGNFSAKSIFALDEESNTVLFEKNSSEVRPLASLTKLMSAIVILELPRDWNEEIKILPEDALQNGDHHVEVGEIFTATELWNAGLIGSANKAISALARTGGVSAEGFVSLMNNKAKILGLENLKFVEPTGLDSGNVGTPKEVAMLLKEALSYEKIKESLQTSEYYLPLPDGTKRRVWSTDWLLTKWTDNDFKEIVGKTGYIVDSDYNFAVRLTDASGHRIFVVVMGASNNENRFSEARDLGEWIFHTYIWPNDPGYASLVKDNNKEINTVN